MQTKSAHTKIWFEHSVYCAPSACHKMVCTECLSLTFYLRICRLNIWCGSVQGLSLNQLLVFLVLVIRLLGQMKNDKARVFGTHAWYQCDVREMAYLHASATNMV